MTSFHRNIWTIVPSSVMMEFIKNPMLITKELKSGPPDRTIYFVKRIDHESLYINFLLEMLKDKINGMEDITFLMDPKD